jgi:hypothetical protein
VALSPVRLRDPLGELFPTSAGLASSGQAPRRRSTWTAFNDVSIALGRGASQTEVIADSIGCSNRTAVWRRAPEPAAFRVDTREQGLQLQMFGFLRLIFLSVAAFILNVTLTRALAWRPDRSPP